MIKYECPTRTINTQAISSRANVLVSAPAADGGYGRTTIKVTDFGLAKVFCEDAVGRFKRLTAMLYEP